MMLYRNRATRIWGIGLAVTAALVLTGCPQGPSIPDPQDEYDRGFDEGFLEDDWYWEGFFDGLDTVDFEPIYYYGDEIPFIDALTFDAGYWDGVWYAYNDAYFVQYHYAFIIGFSEGYDAAFRPDYLSFVQADQHIEFLNGGWADGYHDGFSEGRIFGAEDFREEWPFDWLSALLEYQDGIDADLYPEIDLGTGDLGPVILYEWGVSPFDLKKAEDDDSGAKRLERSGRAIPSLRGAEDERVKAAEKLEMFRPLIDDAKAAYDIQPTTTPPDRGERELEHLDTTRLERIDAYLNLTKETSKTEQGQTTDK